MEFRSNDKYNRPTINIIVDKSELKTTFILLSFESRESNKESVKREKKGWSPRELEGEE